MAVAHPIPPKDNIINLDVIELITDFVYTTLSFAKSLLGFVGVVVLSALLIILIPFLHFALWYIYKGLHKNLKNTYNWMNDASEEDLRQAHLFIERKNISYRPILIKAKTIDKNPITMGISSFVSKISVEIMNLEKSLKKAAYPNLGKEYTEGELKKLEALFSDVEDWKDDSLDSYEVYL